ncbi:MAG: high light inducible protein [Nostoc sp. NOS(2021)]|uniref:high light inducible protein n=1 Tax=Nostoc sp. NOS(2021) TaxID=2815407 RepID=UPI0025D60512|nr:high light inducible protein [Nostoc sp. NOS(2021)]MBN3898067.1 high light inducible protein [Nostoc sp. NOS(2021)]
MGLYPSDSIENTYNGKVRNALELGFTPQSELWNSRLAMVGFFPYLIWGLNGYNVIWELFYFMPDSSR